MIKTWQKAEKCLVYHWYFEYHALAQVPKQNREKSHIYVQIFTTFAPNAYTPVQNTIILEGFVSTGKQKGSLEKLFPFEKIRKKS